ncbi:hypothetical protein TorRG33x02_240070 [Trema orientale]|uniref:Uncharacterized protein n=1 Tax=Trema orientale TaxID=63057 RepID=A0A2P5DWH0_TREOI|nr:hypothetical protein TorRG33x02_240070 [Trema orientale]
MAEEESDESSFKLRRWQRRNRLESASSFVHGWSSSMVRRADWVKHRQWLHRGGKSTGFVVADPPWWPLRRQPSLSEGLLSKLKKGWAIWTAFVR